MAKANHRVSIVRLGEPRVHTNADSLELFDIEGYQVVTRKGSFKAGDLGVYIQPDSVVPQTEPFKFIWADHVGIDGLVPERRRRITVKRLRKEYSEGLLMPINDFLDPYNPKLNPLDWKEGEDVAEVLGVTHYDPDAGMESTEADTATQPRRRYPKTLKGWFFFLCHKLGLKGSGQAFAQEVNFNFPVYDVDALKNFKRVLQGPDLDRPGETVRVTEKIHGSNARYVFVEGEFYAGSRQQWKKRGDNVWWNAAKNNPAIEEWCIAHEGWVLYGEVTPTQKKNGTSYTYGSEEAQFFAFDVLSPDGWVWPGNEGFASTVPVLYIGPWGDNVLQLVDGNSVVPGAKHIREGVVVVAVPERRVPGLGRVQLKIVSNKFLERDGGN